MIVVADIGARGGPHSRWQKQAHVLAFDPDALPETTADNVVWLPYALGARRERRPFFRTAFPPASGLYRFDEGIFARFDARDDVAIVDTVEVDVVDFDTLARELDLPQPDVFKIDAQGAELEILHGAAGHLAGAIAVEVEVWFERPHPDVPLFSEVDLFLRSHGFHLFDLSVQRYARAGCSDPLYELAGGFGTTESGQVIWGDAVYVRDLAAAADADVEKGVAVMTAYGFPDCAAEVQAAFRSAGLEC
jgi:FkbM family methyltransferase